MERLTQEEQSIRELAQAYHAERGRDYEPIAITGYAIASSAENCLYMVNGYIGQKYCHTCHDHHAGLDMLIFLRVGRGFVRLDIGQVKKLCDGDIASTLAKHLFGGGG